MKIALCGSHSTGKTSLAKGLLRALNGVCLPDMIREEVVPQNLFPINEKTPPEGQVWLVAEQWKRERTTPGTLILDKNLLDYLVYVNDSFPSHVKETILMFVRNNAHYDFIFYLPIEFPMESDGIRSDDEVFRQEIDRRYKKLLDDLGVKYIILPSFIGESASKEEAIQKRIDLALSYIKNKS